MNRTIFILLTALLACPLFGQPNTINTEIKTFEKAQSSATPPKNNYFEDIPQRLTYVVLNDDNSMTDLFFKKSVEDNWNLTAFEFCDIEKFNEIKCDTNFYFLLRVDKMPKKGNGPATEFMTFVKGNLYVGDLLEEMPELVSMPMFPEDDRSGRIYSYLPAYINIMQDAIQRIVDRKAFHFRNTLPTLQLKDITGKTILFREGDILNSMTQEELDKMFYGNAKIVSQDEIDTALEERRPNTVVSLIIGPETPVKGMYCYKMLLDTETKQLYLYKKHKMKAKKGAGFLKSDIKLIATPFKAQK